MKPFIFIIDPYPFYSYGLKELIRAKMTSYQTLAFSDLNSIYHYATNEDELILFLDLFIAITQLDRLHRLLSHYPLCTLVLTTPESAFLKHVNLSSVHCHYILAKTASETDLYALLKEIQSEDSTNRTMRYPWKDIQDIDNFELTPRNLELLSLLAEGLTNKQIGDRLYLAEKTIKNNLTRLYTRIGVQNRVEAARFALAHGLGQLSKTNVLLK